MRRGFWRSRRRALRLVVGVAAVASLSNCLLPTRAVADGRAVAVTVTLSPNRIVADGVSTSVATATVSFWGVPLPGLPVTFSSSDGGIRFGSTTDNYDGTYTATLTSSTVSGTPTITATVESFRHSASGVATLTQIAGPAQEMTLSITPPSVVADGTSYATATAAVADAHGNPIPADPVVFSSSNPRQRILPVTVAGNGTYTAFVRSSRTPGPVIIRATDTAAHLSARAVLTQTAAGNIVSLVTLEWTFHYTLAYTRVLALIVNGAPAGTRVVIHCRGQGCPFTEHRVAVAVSRSCGRRRKRGCPASGTINLTPDFDGRTVPAGTRITVAITRLQATGKYYTFDTRAGRPPRVRIACLGPGEARPAGSC